MNFKQALSMLIDGTRIIRKRDYENFPYGWLSSENDLIYYMNEPLNIGASELLEWAQSDDWCALDEYGEISHA